MDPERLSVRLRPRVPWEAVDLGFAMVRRWAPGVFVPWLTLALPCALVLTWTLHFWGLLLFWWLLPLFEAVVLYALSRGVFGELPMPRATLRAAPREMGRAWREVLLRRLHPARSFGLPIGQLEGLTGSDRRQRRRVLSRSIDVQGSVTVVFLGLQALLVCALLALVIWMTPSWMGVDWQGFWDRFTDGDGAVWHYDLVWSAWILVVVALDPFYVAAGFALYLDRRTQLEGWDLELAFRQLARRLRNAEASRADAGSRSRGGSAGVGRAAMGWLGLGCLLATWSAVPAARVDAQEETPVEVSAGEPAQAERLEVAPGIWPGAPDEDPRRVAREITARPEYGGAETAHRWRLREDLTSWLDEEPPKQDASRPNPILLAVVWFLVQLSQVALWLLLLAVLVLVTVVALRRWPESRGRSADGSVKPETLLGFDVRAESLPADVPAAAETLWRGGDPAAALSLLYRAALARLADRGVELAESYTEADCLRAARRSLPTESGGFFAELTGAWQRVAYGHRLPPDADGERYWTGWRRHFAAAGSTARGGGS